MTEQPQRAQPGLIARAAPWVVGGAGLVLLVVLLGALVLRRGAPDPALRGYAVGDFDIGGPIRLLDQRGEPTRLADFRGKVVLLAFGYTHCPDVCPLTLQEMANVRRDLGEDAAGFQGLFVTVDPARDTPERLADYVAHFDPAIVALTGSREAVDEVAGRYSVRYQIRESDSAAGYLVDHTTMSYLIGPDGEVRYVFPRDAGPDIIAAGVRHLLAGRS